MIGGDNADVRSRLDQCARSLLSDVVYWTEVDADAASQECVTEKVGETNQMVSFWEGCLCSLQISLVISESVTFVVAVMSVGCRSSEDGSPQRSFVAARPAVRPVRWVDRPDSSQNC